MCVYFFTLSKYVFYALVHFFLKFNFRKTIENFQTCLTNLFILKYLTLSSEWIFLNNEKYVFSKIFYFCFF